MGGNSQEPDLFADSPGAISGLIRMSSFLLLQRGGLSHRRFIACLQEENGGAECFSCACCFLSAFNSK